jgi:type I site-specific restriction-modification system R (restriction) subunit
MPRRKKVCFEATIENLDETTLPDKPPKLRRQKAYTKKPKEETKQESKEVGSKQEVWEGVALKTKRGYTKEDLMKNDAGSIVLKPKPKEKKEKKPKEKKLGKKDQAKKDFEDLTISEHIEKLKPLIAEYEIVSKKLDTLYEVDEFSKAQEKEVKKLQENSKKIRGLMIQHRNRMKEINPELYTKFQEQEREQRREQAKKEREAFKKTKEYKRQKAQEEKEEREREEEEKLFEEATARMQKTFKKKPTPKPTPKKKDRLLETFGKKK